MSLGGFDVLFYTLAFLVPGFVLDSTLSVFTPRKVESAQLSFLRFLALSCVNYAFWSWLIYLMFRVEFFTAHPVRTATAWGVIILVSPVALGVFLGYFSQQEGIRKILQRIGLNPIHVIPTGWDYKFSKSNKAVWVFVTLKDGSSVAGLFGSKSFASSESGERDLYIQEVFRISDDGSWQCIPRSSGILIRGDQIKHIEFWNDEEETSDV